MNIDDKIDDILTFEISASQDLHGNGRGFVQGQDNAARQLKAAFAAEINKLAPLRVEDYRAVGFRLKTMLDKYDHLTPAQHKGVLHEALCLLAFKE